MRKSIDSDITDFKEVMIGSKIVQVPTSWSLEKIGSFKVSKKIKAGGTPRATNDEYYGGNIKYLKIKDMSGAGKYIETTKHHLTQEGLDSASTWLVPEGSLLLSMYASYGKAAITRDTMATNQAILGIVPSDSINLDYLFYASSRLKPYFESVVLETTQANLNKSIVENTPILLPPLPEQQRIAEILSTVDELIHQTEEISTKATDLITQLRRDLILGGISHSEYQPFRIGPFEFEIPCNWDMARVEEVAENLDRHRVPVKKENRKKMNGDIPYYGASGQIDTIDDWLFDDELLLIAEDGENLLSRHKPIAFKTNGKIWVNNHIHVIKPNSDMSIEYLLNYFEILNFEPYATGTAQPKLNQKVLNSLVLPIPPKEEQDKISDILGKLNKIIHQEWTFRKRLQELKRGLMQDLLTGKVRVPVET